jgi:hypothetical protein
MTVPEALSFPGSRVLAGWRSDLRAYHPQSLWIAHVVLHRVEAMVRSTSAVTLDRLSLLLIRFSTLTASLGTKESLNALSLDRSFLVGMLQGLARDGLIQRGEDGNWRPTPAGSRALAEGKYEHVQERRRVFAFLATLDGGPAHFVNVLEAPEVAGSFPAFECGFDPAEYHACFTQTPEWKRRHGFPENVTATTPFSGRTEETTSPPSDWRRVLVDHPSRAVLALAQTVDAAGTREMLGFWIDPRGWVLHSGRPAVQWRDGWRDVFPSMRDDIPMEAWRKTWNEWCHSRGLQVADVERCSLIALDHRLIVHTSRRLIERLKALRSDALKGEAWLLAGNGAVRRAALLEVIEADPEGKPSTRSHSQST